MSKQQNFIGEKNKYVLFLGDKNVDNIPLKHRENFIRKELKKVSENIIKVSDIEYQPESDIILKLLKEEEVEGVEYKKSILSNYFGLIKIFEGKKDMFLIIPERNKLEITLTGDALKDSVNIFKTITELNKDFPNIDTSLHMFGDKKYYIGSFGTGSILGDYLSKRFKIKHFAFNPTTFEINATIYKIRGDIFSLFSLSTKKDETFEIHKKFKYFDVQAHNINNF
jgi:hypothetical protein